MKDNLTAEHLTWNDKQINATVTVELSKHWVPFEFTSNNRKERNKQLHKYWKQKIKMGGNWLAYFKKFGMGAAILWLRVRVSRTCPCLRDTEEFRNKIRLNYTAITGY